MYHIGSAFATVFGDSNLCELIKKDPQLWLQWEKCTSFKFETTNQNYHSRGS